jgi:hypothetical protein
MPYPPSSESITASCPITSSIVPPIPVPTYGPGGSFSVLARTRISASPSACLSLIRDTPNWHKWNTFCPSITLSPKSPPPPSTSEPNIPTGNEGWLELGTIGTIDVFMSGDGLIPGRKRTRTQGMIVTVLSPLSTPDGKKGYRLAWKGTSFSHWQLHSERVMEFIEIELGEGKGEGTEFSCWETFAGVLTPIVKATYGGTLIERFGDYNRDVKAFLESTSPSSFSSASALASKGEAEIKDGT